jgi:DNA polymerase-1
LYLDYIETPTYVIDIEADSLDPAVIWVMCWLHVQTGEKGECRSIEEIRSFFERTKGAYYVGHNILKFDAPVLVRLADVVLGVHNCIDTLVLSTLYSPSLAEGHSLGAWGEKLGYPKIEFNEWDRLSEEMVVYCHQDVLITAKLFVRLIKTLDRIGFSERSIAIQHKFTVIIDRQQRNGFKFDGVRARELYLELRHIEKQIEEKVHEVFPPTLEEYGTYKRAYRKDGSHSAQYLRHSAEFPKVVLHDDGTYTVYDYVPFNIGSPNQRTAKLLALGWEPQEFTDKTPKGGGGNPKPFDKGKLSPSLEKFVEENDAPTVKLIAQWMSVNGRANMVKTWLDNWNEDDGCIHGKLFVADTLRLRHQAPNTANIPAVRSNKEGDVLRGLDGYYTYETRDLWVARAGRVLVGTDAAGLELRMLAHYLNRADFTKQVVEGDPHQYNADVVGITRPQAKTLIYAIMYGAAAPKIAKTLGVSVKEGAKIRHMFLERLGLKELIEEAQYEQQNGRVSLVDGSMVVCPSPHAALNYKLQGGGARVMAGGAIILESTIRRRGMDCLKVGDIHDEWQYDCDPDDAETHRVVSVEAIRDSGEMLNLNVPLWGDSKIGMTWAETH